MLALVRAGARPHKTLFRLEAVPAATCYRIEIQYYDHESRIWRFFGLCDLKDTVCVHRYDGTTLGRWRVWAVDAAGEEGPKSDWREFEYPP